MEEGHQEDLVKYGGPLNLTVSLRLKFLQKILTYDTKGKKPLAMSRQKWEDSIRKDLQKRYQHEKLG